MAAPHGRAIGGGRKADAKDAADSRPGDPEFTWFQHEPGLAANQHGQHQEATQRSCRHGSCDDAVDAAPDGRWLAYQSDESGEDRIYVRPFPDVDGGRFPISAGGGTEPLWSPDGRELFYRSGDSLMAVPVRTESAFEAGSAAVLFTGSYRARNGRMYDIAPDGQRFLMVKQLETSEGGLVNHVILVENWFEELKRLAPTD